MGGYITRRLFNSNNFATSAALAEEFALLSAIAQFWRCCRLDSFYTKKRKQSCLVIVVLMCWLLLPPLQGRCVYRAFERLLVCLLENVTQKVVDEFWWYFFLQMPCSTRQNWLDVSVIGNSGSRYRYGYCSCLGGCMWCTSECRGVGPGGCLSWPSVLTPWKISISLEVPTGCQEPGLLSVWKSFT